MKEIEKIIKKYDEAIIQNERLALGTVVKVEGSAYRRIGARLLVSETGQWTGGISGGCLEGDALKRAKIAILNNENSIVVYDTTEDDPHQIGVGLGCNGRIEVLFTPIKIEDSSNQITFLKKIINKRTPTILLQILSVKNGEASLSGQFFTTADIHELSQKTGVPVAEIEEKIAAVFYKRKSNIFYLKNKNETTYEILFEHIRPKIKLICIGDNYDVGAMINVAYELGWAIHLIGQTRKINKTLLQKTTTFLDIKKGHLAQTDEYTAIVLMSHDYKTDLQLLSFFLDKKVPYIGLLGPKKRMLKMNDELNEKGIKVDLSAQSNLYAPIGLDIGAETPEEIALSIAAEIIAVFRDRGAGFLKNRIGSIHKREI